MLLYDINFRVTAKRQYMLVILIYRY